MVLETGDYSIEGNCMDMNKAENDKSGLLNRCPSCGKALPQGVVYCIGCGNQRKVVAAPTPSIRKAEPLVTLKSKLKDTEIGRAHV